MVKMATNTYYDAFRWCLDVAWITCTHFVLFPLCGILQSQTL